MSRLDYVLINSNIYGFASSQKQILGPKYLFAVSISAFITTSIKPTIPILYRSVDWGSIIQDCNQYYVDRLGYAIEE